MSGFVLVAYDITSDRLRSRLFQRLEASLTHVQKSVFEGPVSAADLARIRQAVRDESDPRTDTVRLYHLCSRCRDSTELYGTSLLVPRGDEDIFVE